MSSHLFTLPAIPSDGGISPAPGKTMLPSVGKGGGLYPSAKCKDIALFSRVV